MSIKELILDILCDKCNITNYEFCEKHCETHGEYKVVKTLIERLENEVREETREDIEYCMWEQSMGDDL